MYFVVFDSSHCPLTQYFSFLTEFSMEGSSFIKYLDSCDMSYPLILTLVVNFLFDLYENKCKNHFQLLLSKIVYSLKS